VSKDDMTKHTLLAAALALIVGARTADAFCGFYVATGDEPMFNDATQVVLMRKGTRTVLAMQNHYKGPVEAFAMVIPVPTVLQERDVKTLTPESFDLVEKMGSPRLVEYWEQDPCGVDDTDKDGKQDKMALDEGAAGSPSTGRANLGVKIEAQFAVGEYQILILSAKDSTGLDTWLRKEGYQIPAGAEPLLRPYVETGMKFFVAKVDPKKVKFEGNQAVLSPLRFHYDSEQFNLPIRLGLANSAGTQDLIVNILSPRQRYEVANGKNVTIPTNLNLRADVRDKFGAFYVALFDATVEKHPGAVVTEYAWDATSCDPCPGPTLTSRDLQTLGADVLEGSTAAPGAYASSDFVLTRLHARYGKSIKDDLQFKAATPIAGGREHLVANGQLEEGAQGAQINNFQARYIIRHPWTGPITCANPVRGRWGGPDTTKVQPALDLAFAPRGSVKLAEAVAQNVPELDLQLLESTLAMTPGAPARSPSKSKTGCGCQSGEASGGLLFAVIALFVRRRKP
jgi:MYXO-CTERM domain-containing protein